MHDTLDPADIHAVLFDFGMVLSTPPYPAAWERLKQILGTDEDAFHRAYWRPRHPYDRGDLTARAYWHEVAADLHRTLSEDDLQALLAADIDLWTQPNVPMVTWASQLQQAGMRTGILSNLGDAMEVGLLERCGWLQDFAHHTFSHRLGIAKPEAAIYAHAADGLRTSPQHILFIDDRADNIEAARQAGMQTVHYTSHADFLAAMHRQGLDDLLAPAPKV